MYLQILRILAVHTAQIKFCLLQCYPKTSTIVEVDLSMASTTDPLLTNYQSHSHCKQVSIK